LFEINFELRESKVTSRTMSSEEVAKAFVQHFYQTFDADAQNLVGLFVSRELLRIFDR
jgi:hypothetical protein